MAVLLLWHLLQSVALSESAAPRLRRGGGQDDAEAPELAQVACDEEGRRGAAEPIDEVCRGERPAGAPQHFDDL